MIIAQIRVVVQEAIGVELDEDTINAICDTMDEIDFTEIIKNKLSPLGIGDRVVIKEVE